MRIKTFILLMCVGLLLPIEGLADVATISFRFNERGEIVEVGTLADSVTLSSNPIIEPSVPEMIHVSDEAVLADADDPEIAEPNKCETAGGTGTVDDCECPDDGEFKQYNGNYWCCQDGLAYKDGVYMEPGVRACSCADDIDECTTKELCDIAAQYNNTWGWCGTNGKCLEDVTTCPETCQSGMQEAEDGNCYACPDDGELKLVDNEYICCGKSDGSHQYSSYDGEDWNLDSVCGCPIVSGEGEDAIRGVSVDGVCCYEGNYWNGDWENGKAVYDIDVEVCGCPTGWIAHDNDESSWCCDHTNGKLRKDDAEYSLETAEDSEDSSETNMILRACGCPTGTSQKTDGNEMICCNGSSIAWKTTGVPAESDERYCGCPAGKEYDEGSATCIDGCVTDAFCQNSGAGKRCLKTSSGNRCVECLNASDCANDTSSCPMNTSAKVCDTSAYVCKTCTEKEGPTKPYRGLVSNGCNSCYECVSDEDCSGRADNKKVCDPTSKMCVICVLDVSNENPNNGCNETGKPYCVNNNSGQRGCSECRTNTDCRTSDKKICSLEAAVMGCATDCGSVGMRPDGTCNCPADKPVWDIYRKMCTFCYDSITEDWTDLGCGNSTSPSSYSPRENPKTSGKPICKVDMKSRTSYGECVQCENDRHCESNKVCTNNACGCSPDLSHWHTTLKKCVGCTHDYGTTADTANNVFPCAVTAPKCKNNKCTGKCTVNYGVTESGKVACSSADKPYCNSNNECTACPSATPNWNSSSHQCVAACGENSTWDKDLNKCKCNDGYGVVDGKCVVANTASIKSTAASNCKKQACESVKIFEFTTVKDMLYELTFKGSIFYGDWASFQCEGEILGKTKSSESGKKKKQWCSQNKEKRDMDPDDGQYCSCAAESCSCYNGGAGYDDGKGCARRTLTTKDDNVQFLGDGKKCTFTVTNGNGDCTNACDISSSGSLSVVPVVVTYESK